MPWVYQSLCHHLLQDLATRVRALLRVEVMLGVNPTFPFQPKFSRMLGIQVVLDFEAEAAGEILRPIADKEMMVRLFHHRFGYKGRRAHSFEGADAARTFLWSVHAAGIKLHRAVRVRQAAVADAVIERIELDNVYARDQRVEHISSLRHHGEGLLDTGNVASILELIAIGGCDHDGFD